MKKILVFCSVLLATLAMSSCYTSKVYVGNARPSQPMIKVGSTTNPHLIQGLVPLDNGKIAAEYIGGRSDYMIKFTHRFLDGLLKSLTLGMYTPCTTAFYAPMDMQNNNTQTSSGVVDAMRVTHIVKAGETLSSIATQYGVTIKDIVKWNNLSTVDVVSGTSIIIYIK